MEEHKPVRLKLPYRSIRISFILLTSVIVTCSYLVAHHKGQGQSGGALSCFDAAAHELAGVPCKPSHGLH